MTTEVRSIQTRYAGCFFRSRLEARWARFFDAAAIEWEYEPQGYEVTWRLDNSDDTFNYLPDFWLPGRQVWGEVKGSLTRIEAHRLYNAAASLSSNNGGGCHDSGGHDLVLFGPLTKGIRFANPVQLHMHKGDLQASCFWCGPHVALSEGGHRVTVANDSGDVDYRLTDKLLAGFVCNKHSHIYRDALDTARRARFEFGARG